MTEHFKVADVDPEKRGTFQLFSDLGQGRRIAGSVLELRCVPDYGSKEDITIVRFEKNSKKFHLIIIDDIAKKKKIATKSFRLFWVAGRMNFGWLFMKNNERGFLRGPSSFGRQLLINIRICFGR